MISREAAEYLVENLTPDSFYRYAHNLLYTAIKELVDKKVEVDGVTLMATLAQRHQVDECGGPSYVSSLTDGVPRATNVVYYCEIIRDLKLKRDLYFVSEKLVGHIYMGDHTGRELVQMADSWVLDLEKKAAGSGDLQPISATIPALYAKLEHRLEHRGELTGLNTGLTAYNEMTGGLQPGDLTIVAARPSVGKTALVGNMAVTAARAWKAAGDPKFVAFFSLEMTEEQLQYRLLSHLSGVMLYKILHGHCGPAEQHLLGGALNELHDLPIAIDDTSTVTAGEIRAKCRRLKMSKGLGLIIIDYVQLVAGSDRRSEHGNRASELGDISRRVKIMAKELEVPALLLSQLSRAPEGREDKRPRLSDLRESGALEQDADNVVMIHRADHKVGGKCELIIEKQRNGPTGPFEVEFDKETTTFRDARPGDPQEEPPPSLIDEEAESGRLQDAPARGSSRHVRSRRR